MKIPRLLVFLAGLAGVVAFFMPLIQFDAEVEGKKLRAEISAFRMVSGITSIRDVVKGDYQVSAEEDKKFVTERSEDVDKSRVIYMVAFAPGIHLLLAAIAGRLGRGKATIALIAGLLGVGIWLLLKAGFEKALSENKTGVAFEAGLALTLLMVVGIAGSVGGLLGLISPERKPDAPGA